MKRDPTTHIAQASNSYSHAYRVRLRAGVSAARWRRSALALTISAVALLILLICLVGLPSLSSAASLYHYVTPDGTDSAQCTIYNPCRTIQRAVANAKSTGEEIRVAAGYYTGTVTLNKNLALRGGFTTTNWVTPDPERNITIIDAQDQPGQRVINVTASTVVAISGFRLTGGNAPNGAGVQNAGTLTVESCHIYRNQAIGAYGGGVANGPLATLILRRSKIYSNTAASSHGGGIYIYSGNAVLEANEIFDNSASTIDGTGGAINVNDGTVAIKSNLIYSNTATWGGGILVNDGAVTIENNTFYNNHAVNQGGGIYAWSGTTAVTNTLIVSNTATAGGGIYSNTAGLSVAYSDFYGNAVNHIEDPSGPIDPTTFGSNNDVSDPLFVDPQNFDLHIPFLSPARDSGTESSAAIDFEGNGRPYGLAMDRGADEYTPPQTCYARPQDGTVYPSVQEAVNDAAATGNIVQVAGTCAGTVSIDKSLTLQGGYTATDWLEPLYGPTVLDAQGLGRVIYAAGGTAIDVTIENMRIVNGTSGPSASGGGVYLGPNVDATLRNNVIYNNTASLLGGGVYNDGGYTELEHNTVYSNVASIGGGVYISGTAALASNIVVNNHAVSGGGISASGTGVTLAYNDFYGNTTNDYGPLTPGATDISAPPGFVDAGAGDFHLALTSPAINAADPASSLGSDFEGENRPLGTRSDIGADESRWYTDVALGEAPNSPLPVANVDDIRGKPITFTHTITNVGNTHTLTDSFLITTSNSDGWDVTVSAPSPITLNQGESISFDVVVSVPVTAADPVKNQTTIAATSQTNPTGFDTAQDLIAGPGLEFTPNYTENADPGEVITYTHTLTNTGPVDTFTLDFSSSRGWGQLITPTGSITLTHQEAVHVIARVQVIDTAPATMKDVTTIKATSSYSVGIFAVVTDTTTANPTTGDRYVSVSGGIDTDNNCTQQDHPCASIGYAVNQAAWGDTIFVAQGTYYEVDILLNQNVNLRGGYVYSGGNFNLPGGGGDPTTTIIDTQNAGRGLRVNVASTHHPVVSGFTIQNGTTSGYGGAIYVQGSSAPTLTHLILTDSTATRGGGIYVAGGSPVIQNVAITGTSASDHGGGIYVKSGNVAIQNVAITGTVATDGAGVYLAGGNTIAEKLMVTMCTAGGQGGGVYHGGGVLLLSQSRIGKNSADIGGGIYHPGGDLDLWNTFVYSNTASTGGGGGVYQSGGTLDLLNDTLYANQAATSGGGLFDDGSSASVISNTIVVANSATSGGSGIHRNSGAGSLTVDYCDVWGNTGTPSESNVSTGPHSLSVDPLFEDASTGDLHITFASPCNDVADPGTFLTTDIDGDLRPSNQGFDIGADELAGCLAKNQRAEEVYGVLQDAIDEAQNSDVIMVSGTCWGVRPRVVAGQMISQTAFISKSLTLAGGYDSSFSNDPATSPVTTTLNAQEMGRTLVITGPVSVIVSHFTLAEGDATGLGGGPGGADAGGSLYNHNATLVLQGLTIVGSQAALGGGMYSFGGQITWQEPLSHIADNSATYGGGFYLDGGTPIVENVSFVSNLAGEGGGIYNASTLTTISGTHFVSNTASIGGGIYNASGLARAEVISAAYNSAGTGGSFYNANGARLSLRRSVVLSNTASGDGGGVYNAATGELTLINTLVVSNTADTGSGGGLYNPSSQLTVRHVTFYGNSAGGQGGGIYHNSSSPEPVINSTLIVNNAASAGGGIYSGNADPDFDYNDVHANSGGDYGGLLLSTDGTGNISADPMFISTEPTSADFLRLAGGSPAEDTGDPNSPVDIDIEGEPRPSNRGFDIGADEIGGCYVRINGAAPTYGNIQLATDLSNPGDKLHVAGTCQGVNPVVEGSQTISQTVFVNKSLSIQGGYTLTNWTDPDPAVYTTTLDALALGRVVYVTGSITVTVDGLHLRGGSAVDGGAIFAASGILTVTRNHIHHNDATNGGALYNLAATTIVSGCQIYSNTADLSGGGLYIAGGEMTLDGSDLHNNWADVYGGAFYHAGGSAVVQNNVIRENATDSRGGGVYNAGTGLTVWHNTLYVNTATTEGGGLYTTNDDPTVVSNIFYSNGANTGHAIYGPASLAPDYNDVMPVPNAYGGGASAGSHTLFVDPLFVNAPAGDFHLLDDSPVIDRGDPTVTLLHDFERDYRPADQGFDIGADERQGCWARIVRTGVIYGNPQRAIDDSISGDVIQVTIGECRGVHPYDYGGNVVSQTVHIPHNLTLNGGFSRDFASGGNAGPGVYPDGNATTFDPLGRGRAVLVTNGVAFTMTRFILVNGNAAGLGGGPGNADAGGAFYYDGDRGILEHVDFYSSTAGYGGALYSAGDDLNIYDSGINFSIATFDGGAIYNAGGSITVAAYSTGPTSNQSSRVYGNTAGDQGGGIYNASGNMTILDNNITLDEFGFGGANSQNRAAEGGFLYNDTGQVALENNTIFFNEAEDGGAMYNNAGTLTLEGDDIYDNSATNGGNGRGGGILNNGGTLSLDGGSQLHDNTADGYGGAIHTTGGLTIWNTLIYSNTARDQGGGIYFTGGGASVLHNTFYNNGVTAPTGQGGCMYVASGSPTIKNTIFYACTTAGTTPGSGGAVMAAGVSAPTLDYNDYFSNLPDDVSGASDGGNSLYVNPELAGPGSGDFHLNMFSPLIDQGEELGVPRDFEGDPRPINLGPDIGADEYNACLARVESSQVVYGRIQDALNNAVSGDTIRVAEGICYESIVIDDDVTIDGSWEKDFSDHVRDDEDRIILSTYVDALGGGRVATINNSAGSVSISYVTLRNGDTAGDGGGIWSAASNLTVFGSSIWSCEASNGGGIYLSSGIVALDDVDVGSFFNGNTADTHGGGIYVATGVNATIQNGGILYNEALGGSGGGLYVSSGSQVYLSGGYPVQMNKAAGDGGGVYSGAASFELRQKQINSNEAGGSGGGIYAASSGDLTLINLGLYDNTATSGDGGGLYRDGSGGSVEMQHATIRLNDAGGQGGGVYNTGGAMEINASIIASNSSGSGGSGIHGDTGASVTVKYSLRWINTYVGTTSGSGNIVADPHVMDASGNLHYFSPAIDAVPTDASDVSVDRTLDSRPQLCAKDMGRDEYAVGVRNLDWMSSPFPGSQTGDPGESLDYTFSLRNDSEHWLDLSDSDSTLGPGTGYTETVAFTLSSSKGWSEIITITGVANPVIAPDGQSATVDIGPGDTAYILVRVTIPPDAYASLPDDYDTMDLSRLHYSALQCPSGTPRTSSSPDAFTSVTEIRDFIIAPDNTGTALPGEVVTYTHTLTNTGNITDTYDIIPKAGFYASAEIVQPSSGQVTLAPHQTATLIIEVTINPEAAGGLTDISSVIARSNREPPLEKAAANSTAIQYTTGTRYVSLSGQDSLVDESEVTGVDYKDNNCTQPGVAACRTIQQAVDQAAHGNLIKIDQGVYTDIYTTTYKTQALTQTAFVDKSVTLQGGYDKDNWEESPPNHISQTTAIDPQQGRAFYITEGVTVTLDRLTIRNGDAAELGGGPSGEDAGGGIYNEGANLTLNAIRSYSNTAELGGSLYHDDGDLLLQNNLFHGNAAGTAGGGVYVYTGTATLRNNTFYDNQSSGDGSAIYVASASLSVTNTIFADNNGGAAVFGALAPVSLDYNLYYNNSADTGGTVPTPPEPHDVMADPLFVAPGDDPPDLHLQSGSPAREAGDPATDTGQMPLDHENNPRILGPRVDIGAYEYVIQPGVVIEPDHTTLVSQGTAVTYTHTLTNTGDLTDTYTISIGSSQGWATLLTPASVELSPGQTATVQVRVDVPSPGFGGVTDVTIVTAQSLTPSISDSAVDTTNVEMTAGVEFEPDRASNADPGTVITYTHTLTNTGDGPDTFILTHYSSEGWTVSYDTPVAVGYGMTSTVIVSVTVPTNALSGVVDTTTITATSQHTATVSASVVDTTAVNQVAGVELEPDRAATVGPGTTIAYTHMITNTGNGADTFDIEAVSTEGWVAGLSPVSVSLAPGEAHTVVVTITVPPGTPSGTVDAAFVTATSQYNPFIWDTAIDTTTVVCEPLTDVTISGPSGGYTGTLHIFDGIITPSDATAPIIYTWSPVPASGQGTASAGYQWASPGTYTITLTAENCGGIVSDTHTITIEARPPTCPNPLTGVTISGPTSGYTGTAHTFDGTIEPPNATAPVFYTWSPVPASGQGTASAGYQWTSPGTYTITLTAENCGGIVSDTHVITIEARPPTCPIPLIDVTVFGPTSGYTGTTYTFTSTVAPPNATAPVFYTWSPAPASGQGTASADYQWASPGTYTITLTSENCGGVVSDTHVITIEAQPPTCPIPLIDVTVFGPTSGYTGTTYTFTSTITPPNATAPVVYTWSPAPASGQGTASADYQWASPGTYTITLTVENCGGGVTDTHVITISATPPTCPNPLTGVTISGPTSGYTGTLYTFDGAITPLNATAPVIYTWSPAPASGQGTASAQYQWASPDIYTITLTAENCGGIFTDTHTITIAEQQTHLRFMPLVFQGYESPVPNRPDLVITDISVEGPVNAGEPVTVRVTVENQGDQPVAFGNNFYVDLYVDRQPAPLLPGDVWWGVQGAWFGVGESVVLTAPYTFTAGTHQLYAQADTDNTVAERLESNNTFGAVVVTAAGAAPDEEPVAPTPLPEADIPRPTPTPMP